MGKFVNYVRNEKGFILSLVLMILGIAFGDASVLMAEGVTVAPPAPEGGTATEGHEGLQTQLGGQRQRKREKRIMLSSIIISMLPVSLVSRTLNMRSLQVKNV